MFCKDAAGDGVPVPVPVLVPVPVPVPAAIAPEFIIGLITYTHTRYPPTANSAYFTMSSVFIPHAPLIYSVKNNPPLPARPRLLADYRSPTEQSHCYMARVPR